MVLSSASTTSADAELVDASVSKKMGSGIPQLILSLVFHMVHHHKLLDIFSPQRSC